MSRDERTPIHEFVDFHLWFKHYASAKPEEAQVFAAMLRERGLTAIDSMLQELPDEPGESESVQ